MTQLNFDECFTAITGNPPFPWQRALFQRFVAADIPGSCQLPTGLGKTSIIAVWLIALAKRCPKTPRRLVYVVNRRTVVDQTTEEVARYRNRLKEPEKYSTHPGDIPILRQLASDLAALCAFEADCPLAVSTLRGQFADNREWSADPTRPAVIVGTVDMIGSRLLFGGYGVGFKAKPLHAGFLGQDVLLVHDEAHLEPAFQSLLDDIESEQQRCNEFAQFRVVSLSATSRGRNDPFKLTDEENNPPESLPNPPKEPIHFVWRRQRAAKRIHLHQNIDEKKVADEIADLALRFKDSGRAVIVFVRKVDDAEKVVSKLRASKVATQQLTGTLRGLERDQLVEDAIFRRFTPGEHHDGKTAFLVCTSAGEVGVNISADHLVCDLTTFDSMVQRFGRVNRFGDRNDTEIHIVHPRDFDDADEIDPRRRRTQQLLLALNGDGSPKSLDSLDPDERLAAFAPTPEILPTSDILFDNWAMTSIRGKLPGRPPVEPYLHGRSDWEPPATNVAWRDEVSVVSGELLQRYDPVDLLEDYPLKPHELLRDSSSRVFDRLKRLKAEPETPVWIVSDDGSIEVSALKQLVDSGKERLDFKTVLLPPSAGGLDGGMLTAASTEATDVADEWYDETRQRRVRVWDNDPKLAELQKNMRLIRTVDIHPPSDDVENDSTERHFWYWYEFPSNTDGDCSKGSTMPVAWQVHTDDVVMNAERIVGGLTIPDELKFAVIAAAKFHDLGKKRVLWQRSIGNPTPTKWLAKSGGKMKRCELGDTYRHEFGSIVDLIDAKQMNGSQIQALSHQMRDLVLHLVAAHHGFGRPHFPRDQVFDPEPKGLDVAQIATEIPLRFVRLQRIYGRWGLAYIESLLRAADYAASANPSQFVESV